VHFQARSITIPESTVVVVGCADGVGSTRVLRCSTAVFGDASKVRVLITNESEANLARTSADADFALLVCYANGSCYHVTVHTNMPSKERTDTCVLVQFARTCSCESRTLFGVGWALDTGLSLRSSRAAAFGFGADVMVKSGAAHAFVDTRGT
jgi:hypothetical protein